MIDFKGFPDIEGFHNVVKVAKYHGSPTVEYRGKIKLHGTNAGVRIKDGEVAAQSRSRIITSADDNAGFAAWVESNKDWSLSLGFEDAVIFGEWCGPGIMKGTAINKIPNKIFAVFSVHTFGADEEEVVVTNPDLIVGCLAPKDRRPSDVFVIPWIKEEFTAEYDCRHKLQETADAISSLVEKIEDCDPWVKETFGVEGVCEGIVWYPIGHGGGRKFFSDFIFKSKGGKHRQVTVARSVQVCPEVAASI